MARERTPDGPWETRNDFLVPFHYAEGKNNMALISENTFLSHSPQIHGSQAEQFHYHYVAERENWSVNKSGLEGSHEHKWGSDRIAKRVILF